MQCNFLVFTLTKLFFFILIMFIHLDQFLNTALKMTMLVSEARPVRLAMDAHTLKWKDKYLPPANEVWGKVIFSEACVKNSVRSGSGGGYPRMPCRSHDQPAVYKQLHCWWVSVGEEAAYR